MLEMGLFNPDRVRRILCLGAHSDDVEIGCGGTLLEAFDRNPDVHVTWVVFSARDNRETEARSSASAFLDRVKADVITHAFRDGFFPYNGADIKNEFEALKGLGEPDLIFTHYDRDCHQDHRLISELTWNTFRNHLILEYEIPKYDGNVWDPNVYVPLDGSIVGRKVEHLMTHFGSQRDKRWYDEETFKAVMRLRGVECQSPSGFAEAFHARKIVIE